MTDRTNTIARFITHTAPHSASHSASALVLSLAMTLLALGSLNHLATAQHAGTVLAKAAAAQQAQASAAAAAKRS